MTGVLRGARPGPVVLLRGDMDALPIQERTGLEHASRIDGAMHACGHDLHTTMLVGAAHLLAGRRDELSGDVVFMFQPGEEAVTAVLTLGSFHAGTGRNIIPETAVFEATVRTLSPDAKARLGPP